MNNPYGNHQIPSESTPYQSSATPYYFFSPVIPHSPPPHPYFVPGPSSYLPEQHTPDRNQHPVTPRRHRVLSPILSPSPKRKQPPTDENEDDLLPRRVKKPKTRMYTPRKSIDDKLGIVFAALESVGWSLGQFFYYLFRLKDEHDRTVQRSHPHASYVHPLLKGTSGQGIGFILNAWFSHADGIVEAGSDEAELMYSTSVEFCNIKAVRPAPGHTGVLLH